MDLTKQQYKSLINALQIAGSVYGIMGDMVDKKYKKQSREVDELEDLVLSDAKDFDMEHLVEIFQGKKMLKDEYMDEHMDDLMEYEEYAMWDNLARQLAERDIARIYTKPQLEKMDELELIRAESTIEENYWEEFNKYGLERVEIKK